jgi:hypothetical protein
MPMRRVSFSRIRGEGAILQKAKRQVNPTLATFAQPVHRFSQGLIQLTFLATRLSSRQIEPGSLRTLRLSYSAQQA